jgi:hypothetical protein
MLFGGIAIVLAAMARMRRAETVTQVRELAGLAALADRLLPVASLLILVAGIYMAVDLELWGSGWVDLGFLGLIALSIVGPTINSRRLTAIHRAAAEAPDGSVPDVLRARILDPVLWTAVHTMTVVTVGIVFLMAVKPGTTGSLLTLIVAAAIGLAASAPTWKRASQRTAGEA